jgi:hypothetical protein
MARARTTTNHDEIRRWVEARGGWPARVKRTGRGARGSRTDDPGILRIDYPGFTGEKSLERISWDEWFSAFDRDGLAFLFQETIGTGQESRFSKLVARPKVARGGRARSAPARNATPRKAARAKRGAKATSARTTTPRPPARAATTSKRGASGPKRATASGTTRAPSTARRGTRKSRASR